MLNRILKIIIVILLILLMLLLFEYVAANCIMFWPGVDLPLGDCIPAGIGKGKP